MAHDLCELTRLTPEREEEPSAAVMDGRTLQSTPESGHRAGFDGHKRKRGGKSVEVAFVDQGYTGESAEAAAEKHGIKLVVLKHDQAKRGFVRLPRRWVLDPLGSGSCPYWVVERSFAWTSRFRRLARDYERLAETLRGLHFLAFACLLLHRLLPLLTLPVSA